MNDLFDWPRLSVLMTNMNNDHIPIHSTNSILRKTSDRYQILQVTSKYYLTYNFTMFHLINKSNFDGDAERELKQRCLNKPFPAQSRIPYARKELENFVFLLDCDYIDDNYWVRLQVSIEAFMQGDLNIFLPSISLIKANIGKKNPSCIDTAKFHSSLSTLLPLYLLSS